MARSRGHAYPDPLSFLQMQGCVNSEAVQLTSFTIFVHRMYNKCPKLGHAKEIPLERTRRLGGSQREPRAICPLRL